MAAPITNLQEALAALVAHRGRVTFDSVREFHTVTGERHGLGLVIRVEMFSRIERAPRYGIERELVSNAPLELVEAELVEMVNFITQRI